LISTPSGSNSPLTSSELSLNSLTGQISLWTGRAATVGFYTATFSVKLTSYPNVTLSETIQIEITPCVVTSCSFSANYFSN
jgi:hypothetical protein